MTDDQLFEAAELDYLNGKRLSVERLSLIERYLSSVAARARSIACGALLCNADSNNRQKTEARKILKTLCVETDHKDVSTMTELSITLLLIPFEETNIQVVRDFVDRLFRSEYFTHRGNAVLLLGRFALHGDADAISLLRSAAEDSNVTVRANASKTIEKLGLS